MRFLNADEIARGLSPLDPTLSAFQTGRLLLEEARSLTAAKASFAIESTLSGKTHVALIRKAKARGYRILLHYIVIGSATQAVARVALAHGFLRRGTKPQSQSRRGMARDGITRRLRRCATAPALSRHHDPCAPAAALPA